MRDTTKLGAVLALGTVLGGCSMAGTGDYFADDYAHLQQIQMPQYYGAAQNPCGQAFAPAPSYHPVPQNSCGSPATNPNAYAYGQSVQSQYGNGASYGQGVPYGQSVPYGQNVPYGQTAPYVQNAPYGQNVPYGHGAYVPPSYGANPYALRGRSKGFESHAYGTLGAVSYEAGEDLYGAQARLGYQFNKYLGVEAEGSLGFADDTSDVVFNGVPVEQTLGVKNSAAGFGVLRYPLLGKLNGYSRLGYHRTELDRTLTIGTSDPVNSKFSVDGVAYGSGLEYALNPRTSLRLDYTVYDYDGPDADSISLAVSRKF